MENAEYHDGKLVVIVNGINKGRIGLYQFRDKNYDTVYVKQGSCCYICCCPQDLKEYDEFEHGILKF